MRHKSLYLRAILVMVVSAVILMMFYPKSQSKFRYRYALNQPWRYEDLVIAPFDFDVKKSADQIQSEKNAIDDSRIEYYAYDEGLFVLQKNRLTRDYNEGKLPEQILEHSAYMRFLIDKLDEIYTKGVMDGASMEMLSDTAHVYVIGRDNVAKRRLPSEFYSPETAYESIMSDLPYGLDSITVRQAKISSYIIPNLVLDEEKTEQMLEARKAGIEEIIGHVHKGEKIVDQGELVTSDVFQKLEGYRLAYEQRGVSPNDRLLQNVGIFLMIVILLSALLLYLLSFRKQILQENKNLLFIFTITCFFPALTYLLIDLLPVAVYVIPYAMVAVLVRIFIDSRTAFVSLLTAVLLSALVVPNQLEFILVNVIAARVVLVTLRSLSQRSDLIKTTFFVLLSLVVTNGVYDLASGINFAEFDYWKVLYYVANFVFLMFSYTMVYLLEWTFGYVSNIRLVELSDINKPLLRRLSEVAPGTFQHSLNVSILCAAAVDKIGGDIQLVRAGALYHDIGKMRNPSYFTENQSGDLNPHDALSYEDSAKIIIKHVTDGVDMAQKAKLPESVIGFIRTHHGLGLTKFFYIKYKNEHPDDPVDESLFRYPGPNPHTVEQGVMMLADSVEASSRSLTEVTEEGVIRHVNKIVDSIVSEGMLRNTPLTFRDIEVIKLVFCDKILTMNHSRIKYPELKPESARPT